VNGVASALRNSGWAFWIMKLKPESVSEPMS
jgi:hypothetical protein